MIQGKSKDSRKSESVPDFWNPLFRKGLSVFVQILGKTVCSKY